MTYSETFYLLGIALLACIPLALLLKTPREAMRRRLGHLPDSIMIFSSNMMFNRPSCFALAGARPRCPCMRSALCPFGLHGRTGLSRCAAGCAGCPQQRDLRAYAGLRHDGDARAEPVVAAHSTTRSSNDLIAAALCTQSGCAYCPGAACGNRVRNCSGQRANELPKVSGDAAALRTREPNIETLIPVGSSDPAVGRAACSSIPQVSTPRGKSTCSAARGAPSKRHRPDAQAVDADLADTQVSLAAEVAQAYIDLRDQQTRLALAQRSRLRPNRKC